MRYKELFTIYPRKLKRNIVFYYQCYDNNGKRTCGHSTGQRTKTAAKLYCMELYRKGRLLPDNKPLTFGDFSKGWWDIKTCKYLKWRQMQNPLAPTTIDFYKAALKTHINPFFEKIRINSINPEMVRSWVLQLSREGFYNSTINLSIATLKVMMKEAARQKLIPSNPMEKIQKLAANNKEVKILRNEEVQKLFPADWTKIWDSYEVYLVNKLAACTGMRLSEITGLQSERIMKDHIHVCSQYTKKYGIRPLKTKDSRNIPITQSLYDELSVFFKDNGKDFLFTKPGTNLPISRKKLYRETGKAFDRIGINGEERRKRGLALHHWRHFLNTALLMANVSTLKVQKVTGHKSLSMTMHYTHFDSREFTEVLDVQNNLFCTNNDSAEVPAAAYTENEANLT